MNKLVIAALPISASIVSLLYYAFTRSAEELIFVFVLCYWLGLGGVLLVSKRSRPATRRSLALYFSAAFAINVVVTVLNATEFEADPASNGEPFRHTPDFSFDDWAYHQVGIDVSDDLIEGRGFDLDDIRSRYSYIGYPIVLGIEYYLSDWFGGRHPLVPRIFNSLIGAWLVIAIYYLARIIYGRRVAKIAASISLLFPAFWFYSSVTVRDILAALLVTLIAIYSVRLLRPNRYGGQWLDVSLFVAASLGLYYLRAPMIFVVWGGVALFLLSRRNVSVQIKAVYGVVALAASIGVYLFMVGEGGDVERLASYREQYEDLVSIEASSSSLAVRYIHSAPPPFNYILSYIFAIFAPIPPVRQATLPGYIEAAGAVVWYMVIPAWIMGSWMALKQYKARLLFILQFMIILSIALTSINIRHKIQFFPLGIVLAANYIFYKPERYIKATVVFGVILTGSFLVYKIIKG